MIFNILLLLFIFACWMFQNEIGAFYKLSYHKQKTHPKAIFYMIKSISWILYIFMYQKIQKNVVYIQKHEYEVHYIYHGQLYKIKMIGNSNLNKKNIIMILNQSDEDITSDIIPYLGPKFDFHKITYQPKHFNHEEITFYLSNGETRTFSHDQNMISFQ
jgi:hypothetical protein